MNNNNYLINRNISKYHRCGVCGLQTETQAAMVQHLNRHYQSNFISPQIGDYEDQLEIIPLQTIIREEDDNKTNNNCKEFCYSTCEYKNMLWKKYGAILLSKKLLICYICRNTNCDLVLFHSRVSLALHHIWCHKKGKLICKSCNNTFHYTHQIYLHQKYKKCQQKRKNNRFVLTTTSFLFHRFEKNHFKNRYNFKYSKSKV